MLLYNGLIWSIFAECASDFWSLPITPTTVGVVIDGIVGFRSSRWNAAWFSRSPVYVREWNWDTRGWLPLFGRAATKHILQLATCPHHSQGRRCWTRTNRGRAFWNIENNVSVRESYPLSHSTSSYGYPVISSGHSSITTIFKHHTTALSEALIRLSMQDYTNLVVCISFYLILWQAVKPFHWDMIISSLKYSESHFCRRTSQNNSGFELAKQSSYEFQELP